MKAPTRYARFRITDAFAAGAFVLLIVASDFEFRRRDVSDALSGSLDLAVAAELLVFLVLGGWLLMTVARAPKLTKRPVPLAPIWALCSVLALSALWAPSPSLAMVRGMQLLVSVGLVTIIANRARPFTWHGIAHGYTVAVTVGIGLGMVFRRPPEQQLSGRFMWLYGHPVVAASMLTVSSLMALGWLCDRRLPRRWSSTTYAVLFAVHTLALGATQTRGSAIAFAVGVVVLVGLRLPRVLRSDAVLLAFIASPPIIGISLPAMESFILRGESSGQLRTLNSRSGLWNEAWRAFAEKPVFGQGYFASRELFLKTIGLGGAHNAFIEVALSAGLIGVFCLAAVLFSAIRKLYRIGTHPDRPMLAAILVALLVNGLTAQYLAQAGTSANLLFLLICAWIAKLEPWVETPPKPRHPATAPIRIAGRARAS